LIGKDAAKQIQMMLAQSYKKTNESFALIVGIATLMFGATGVFVALQKSLNRVWEVKADPKKSGIKSLLKTRTRSFGVILAIGFLMLISLTLTAGLTALSKWIVSILPHFVIYVFYAIDLILTYSIITVLFALLYKFLPDVIIEWKSVWVGASMTAFLFVLGKYALTIYFGMAKPASTYGAAGSIILVLLWVSYSCLIMFFGAEFTQVYARRYGYSIEPNANAIRIEDDYEVLKERILKEAKEKSATGKI
jgi:membrane protein